jgi:hypothetical protein
MGIMGPGDFLTYQPNNYSKEEEAQIRAAEAARTQLLQEQAKQALLENKAAEQKQADEAATRAILAKLPELMANKQSAEKLGQIDLNDHAGDSEPQAQLATPGLSDYQRQSVADQANAKYPTLGGQAGQNVLGNQGLTADTAKAGGYDVPEQTAIDPNAPQTSLITGQMSGTRYAGVDGNTPHPFSDAQSTDQADYEASLARKAGAGIAQGQAQLDAGSRELGKSRTQVLGDMGGLQYAANSPTMKEAYSTAGTQDQRDAFNGRKMAAMAQENDPLIRQRIALAADDKALGDVYNDKYTQTNETNRAITTRKMGIEDRDYLANKRLEADAEKTAANAATGLTKTDEQLISKLIVSRGSPLAKVDQSLSQVKQAETVLKQPTVTQGEYAQALQNMANAAGVGAGTPGGETNLYQTIGQKIQQLTSSPANVLSAQMRKQEIDRLGGIKTTLHDWANSTLDNAETGLSQTGVQSTKWQALRTKYGTVTPTPAANQGNLQTFTTRAQVQALKPGTHFIWNGVEHVR